MNHNQHFKKVIKISSYLVTGCFILWFIIVPVNESEPIKIWKTLYPRFTLIITGVSLFWLFYYSTLWKWKWKVLRRLFFDHPNLSGTWIGYLKSDYKENSQPLPPIKIVFFIRQRNYFEIRITSQSSKNAFTSYAEIVDFDPSNNVVRLLYHYSQKLTLPSGKNEQQGAADLFLYDDYLAGHYWTLSNTTGFIRVHKLSSNNFQSFEKAEKRFGSSPIIRKCLDAIEQLDAT